MAWTRPIIRNGVGVRVDEHSTTRNASHQVGEIAYAADGTEYVYSFAYVAATAGDFLQYLTGHSNPGNDVGPTTAHGQDIAGLAPITVLINEYFWRMTKGYYELANVASAVNAALAMVGSSSSAGRVDLITFTTTEATLTQLTDGHLASRSIGVIPLAASSSNIGPVLLK